MSSPGWSIYVVLVNVTEQHEGSEDGAEEMKMAEQIGKRTVKGQIHVTFSRRTILQLPSSSL